MAAKKRSVKRTKSEQESDTEGYKVFGRAGTAFTGDWLRLVEAYGGIKKFIETSGLYYDTVYRWAVKGGPVPAAGRIAITHLAHAKGVPIPPMKIPKREQRR